MFGNLRLLTFFMIFWSSTNTKQESQIEKNPRGRDKYLGRSEAPSSPSGRAASSRSPRTCSASSCCWNQILTSFVVKMIYIWAYAADSINCDLLNPAERINDSRLPINLQLLKQRVPALCITLCITYSLYSFLQFLHDLQVLRVLKVIQVLHVCKFF